MDGNLTLIVPRNDATATWMQKCHQSRCEKQIEAAFSPKVVVQCAGCGAVTGMNNGVGRDSFLFFYSNLEQALAEFPEVGKRLGFPSGTRLIHFGQNWMTSDAAIRTVVTW